MNNREKISLRKDQTLPERLAVAFKGLRREMEKDRSGSESTWYSY